MILWKPTNIIVFLDRKILLVVSGPYLNSNVDYKTISRSLSFHELLIINRNRFSNCLIFLCRITRKENSNQALIGKRLIPDATHTPPKIKKALDNQGLNVYLAVWTGLEPATPCVTGRYSNQTELPDQCVKRTPV